MSVKTYPIKYTKLFINNEFVDSVNKKTFETINPANGKKIADIQEAGKEDVDLAVKAAKAAFKRGSEWRRMDASARGLLMNKLANLWEQNKEEIAYLEALDNGKTYEAAVSDVEASIKCLQYFAGYADKHHGDTIPADGGNLVLTRKEPIGVVGQIIPWNFPLLMLAWKWGPALAAGCTIVLKPSELTPLTALYTANLTVQAGFPKGVINIVPGFGPIAGEAIALHEDIRKVAFTGSSIVGKKILEYSGKSNLKKVSLELGGKSPLVIFDDANIDEAVEYAHIAVFTNHGQNCCAGTRTYVQAGIYDEFVKKATLKAKARKVGGQFDQGTQQGPQVDQKSLEKIIRLVETGKKEGAKLETGGQRHGKEGFFFEPTVFSGVKDNMTIAREEIFGPVQSILKFETLDEVIDRANDTNYGLAAGVITKNIDNALNFARGVEAGSVWVNTYFAISAQTPFGGYKTSGIGRELGPNSLEGYLETKTIVVDLPKL